MEDFSPNVLRDEKRVFAYVGGPEKKSMIRHRAKSAWIHPQYLRVRLSLPLLPLTLFRFRMGRVRARTTLQLSASMSPSLIARRSGLFACRPPLLTISQAAKFTRRDGDSVTSKKVMQAKIRRGHPASQTKSAQTLLPNVERGGRGATGLIIRPLMVSSVRNGGGLTFLME